MMKHIQTRHQTEVNLDLKSCEKCNSHMDQINKCEGGFFHRESSLDDSRDTLLGLQMSNVNVKLQMQNANVKCKC